MPPKDIKLGPGTVYFQTPEGLQPLGAITEATVVEPEETEWAEEGPAVIKAAPEDATFTAEVQISPDVAKAFTALGEAFISVVETMGKAVRAFADCVVAIARGVDIAQILKAAKVQKALNEAPPGVRHLALHGKKYRTRKKNINRALREQQRRTQTSDRERADKT